MIHSLLLVELFILHSVNFTKRDILFLIRFLGLFLVLYYGTYAFIGLSVEGGRYIPFLKLIDYVSWYRQLLLKGASQLLWWLGYYVSTKDQYHLYINGRNGIQLVYECLGIGVLSFWFAFIVTDLYGNWKRKLKWVLIGVLVITLLNILRITLLLLSAYEHWINILLFDHHTFYNLILYACVLALLLYYKLKTKRLN